MYGDVQEEEAPPKISHRYNFPKPISEPATPNPSRQTSPHGSDNEGDDEENLSHDSDEEEQELDLATALTQKLKTSL